MLPWWAALDIFRYLAMGMLSLGSRGIEDGPKVLGGREEVSTDNSEYWMVFTYASKSACLLYLTRSSCAIRRLMENSFHVSGFDFLT